MGVCLSPSTESKDSVRAPVQHNNTLVVTSLAGIVASQLRPIGHLHRLLIPWKFIVQRSYPEVVSRSCMFGCISTKKISEATFDHGQIEKYHTVIFNLCQL